jgi:hypothetical protein
MEDFKKLKIWSKAQILTSNVYKKSCNFRKNEV